MSTPAPERPTPEERAQAAGIATGPEPQPYTLSDHRSKIFLDRYALKDDRGKPIETDVRQMWRRVARGLAEMEPTDTLRRKMEQEFYEALEDFKFVPGGRILSGAGTGFEVTFYNCFVIPSPDDSRGGILDNIKILTEIMARGGGVGVNLSTLRPRGSYIKSVNGTSSGPVSWAELYSVITGRVIQQGGTRRGALMIMLDDDHPDIEEFIKAKRIDPNTNKPVTIEHANVSVAVSDAFMEAVKADGDWQTQFPTRAEMSKIEAERERLGGPESGKLTKAHYPKVTPGKVYKARELWRMICEAAWRTAEPGVVFMDRCQRAANTGYYERIRCVNPCGEQPLPDYGVCNLGAINLAAFCHGPIGEATFDFRAMQETVRSAVRMLDNVIDASYYFLPENDAAQKGTRRVGLGTMGLADALIMMGYRYGGRKANEVVEAIYREIRDTAYRESARLARMKGAAPNFDFDGFMQSDFAKTLPQGVIEVIRTLGLRNMVVLTQAPTGTTSMLAGVSSGIEPVFSFVTKREDRLGIHVMYHPLAAAWRKQQADEAELRHGRAAADAVLGSVKLPEFFVASGDLTPEDHIAVQALVQRYTDSSISKTVNAPNHSTVEDVERLYMLAYDTGCKGVTYYRDGSRDAVLTAVKEETDGGTHGQPLDDVHAGGTVHGAGDPAVAGGGGVAGAVDHRPTASDSQTNLAEGSFLNVEKAVAETAAPTPLGERVGAGAGVAPAGGELVSGVAKRPSVLRGYTRNIVAPEGTAHITINSDDQGPFEVFIAVGKAGSDVMALAEAMGRSISLTLRVPSSLSRMARLSLLGEQYRGIGGSRTAGFGPNQVRSLADAVGRALQEHVATLRELGHATNHVGDAAAASDNADIPGAVAIAGVEMIASPTAIEALADEVSRIQAREIAKASNATAAKPSGSFCPECGNGMVRAEGCKICHACGFSEC